MMKADEAHSTIASGHRRRIAVPPKFRAGYDLAKSLATGPGGRRHLDRLAVQLRLSSLLCTHVARARV